MLQSDRLELQETEGFKRWLNGLKDAYARLRITTRLDRLAGEGHLGDAKNVGRMVWELRIHVGPGYRVYFTRLEERIIFLLVGGDKGTQKRDIATAISMAAIVRKNR